MECYEGATMIKTFRGLIADGAQDTVVLHTNDGSIGYRIVKFQGFPKTPGTTAYEHVVKIYKISQSAVDGVMDFSDNTLLAAMYIEGDYQLSSSDQHTILFDQEVFNQDIYITHSEVNGALACNYYIELEQVKLDISESTVATLKDIRNIKRTVTG